MTQRIPHADMLTAAETELVRETLPDNLARLDEEELLEVHARVRRARNKYTTLYRRQGAQAVRAKRSRGAASQANHRTLVKAEVFEDALGRVSHRLATQAKLQAKQMRTERIEAGRAERAGARSATAAKPKIGSKAGSKAGSKSQPKKQPKSATKTGSKSGSKSKAS